MGGGPIGLCAVRILKVLGYGPIVLLEPVPAKRDIALTYGADQVLDPGEEGLLLKMAAIAPGGFEKIFECSGVTANVGLAVSLAADGGEICLVSVMFKPFEVPAPYMINFKEIRLTASISNTHEENIQCLRWMAAGELDAHPLISDIAPLVQLPQVYHERIETGLAVKVLLQIGDEF